MQIEIIVPGMYGDGHNPVALRNAGEILEVRDWYGRSLVASGLAKVPQSIDLGTQVQTEVVEAEVAPPPLAPPAAKPDPFLRFKALNASVIGELHTAGIHTLADLKAAVESGKIVNVPGVGTRRYQKLKEEMGIEAQ